MITTKEFVHQTILDLLVTQETCEQMVYRIAKKHGLILSFGIVGGGELVELCLVRPSDRLIVSLEYGDTCEEACASWLISTGEATLVGQSKDADYYPIYWEGNGYKKESL